MGEALLTLGIPFAISALFEEVVFRGFLLENLRLHFGKIQAVILSAALFAVFHIGFQPLHSQMFLFLFGLLFSLLRIQSVSIAVLTACHALFNIFILTHLFQPDPLPWGLRFWMNIGLNGLLVVLVALRLVTHESDQGTRLPK